MQLANSAFAGALTKERLAFGKNKFRIGQELALFKKGQVRGWPWVAAEPEWRCGGVPLRCVRV